MFLRTQSDECDDRKSQAAKEKTHMSTFTIDAEDNITAHAGLLAGRDFDAHDKDPATPRVLINESVARRFFKDTNPLGRIITFRTPNVSLREEIVGVVGDAKYANMRSHDPSRCMPTSFKRTRGPRWTSENRP